MLTGTLLSNVGPNPATKPLQPDSRHVAATVDAIDAYGCDGDGDGACGDGEVGREEGGTDWILVLITSMGKLRGREGAGSEGERMPSR